MSDAGSPGDNELDQFENLVHQENDGENHHPDEKDREDFFKDIEKGRFFHSRVFYESEKRMSMEVWEMPRKA